MNPAQPVPVLKPGELHIELSDGPLTEAELVRLLWLDLYGYMKDICDSLNQGGSLHWLYLPKDAKLLYSRSAKAAHTILYRVGSAQYALRFQIDFDLRYMTVRIEPCPYTFQFLIKVQGEAAHFCNRDGQRSTAEELATGLMFEFLHVDDQLG